MLVIAINQRDLLCTCTEKKDIPIANNVVNIFRQFLKLINIF